MSHDQAPQIWTRAISQYGQITEKALDLASLRELWTFIWVDFMLKELVKKRDEGSIRKALDEAPNGLSQMIRHVLKDISESLEDSPQYAEDLNEMLTWATCSRRSSDWPKMERPARVRSAKAVCFAPSPQRKDGLATTQLQRRAIYMGEADTHHWRLCSKTWTVYLISTPTQRQHT
ncbi:hypothetical protein GB937_001329 [Aspergillus fischeri]|nr:hypothetical protein GB937_001329 [Aspergillus fischeri]